MHGDSVKSVFILARAQRDPDPETETAVFVNSKSRPKVRPHRYVQRRQGRHRRRHRRYPRHRQLFGFESTFYHMLFYLYEGSVWQNV